MKKSTLIFSSIIVVTMAILIFIHFSNDHVECENISNIKTLVDGVTVKTVEHVCKEKYNF